MKTEYREFDKIEEERALLKSSLVDLPALADLISTFTTLEQIALEGYYKGYTSAEVANTFNIFKEQAEEGLRTSYTKLENASLLANLQCLLRNNIKL